MEYGSYKLIIKGNEDGCRVKIKGKTTPDIIMEALTRTLVRTGQALNYEYSDIIGAIKELQKDEKEDK